MATRNVEKISLLQAMFPVKVLLYRMTLFFMIIAAIGVIIISRSQSETVVAIRTSITDTVTPMISLLSRPVDALVSMRDSVHDMMFVYRENRLLRTQNARLARVQSIASQLRAENLRLRTMLNFVPEPGFSFVTARVISDTGGPYARAVVINAGGRDSVKKGQIVINEKGLVGRILEAGNNSSRVLLLSDINSRVPVVTSKSRERAILSGDNSEYPRLRYLPIDTEIAVGETVITSGDGKFFPAGMPVGVVKEVTDDMVTVEPFVGLGRIEYVNIADYKSSGGEDIK